MSPQTTPVFAGYTTSNPLPDYEIVLDNETISAQPFQFGTCYSLREVSATSTSAEDDLISVVGVTKVLVPDGSGGFDEVMANVPFLIEDPTKPHELIANGRANQPFRAVYDTNRFTLEATTHGQAVGFLVEGIRQARFKLPLATPELAGPVAANEVLSATPEELELARALAADGVTAASVYEVITTYGGVSLVNAQADMLVALGKMADAQGYTLTVGEPDAKNATVISLDGYEERENDPDRRFRRQMFGPLSSIEAVIIGDVRYTLAIADDDRTFANLTFMYAETATGGLVPGTLPMVLRGPSGHDESLLYGPASEELVEILRHLGRTYNVLLMALLGPDIRLSSMVWSSKCAEGSENTYGMQIDNPIEGWEVAVQAVNTGRRLTIGRPTTTQG